MERYFQKTNKVKTSHFVLSRRRASRNFHQILHGDRGGQGHHFRSHTFLGPIHCFAAMGRRKFGWKHRHRSNLLIILSFIEIMQPILGKLCKLRTHINCVNFIKIVQGTCPLGAHSIFSVLGAVNPHPWADQGDIWQGGADLLPAKFHLDGAACRPWGAKIPKLGRE